MRLYSRELPGGGVVVIEALTGSTIGEEHACRARVAVERRTDPKRRDGHAPPIIAEAEAPSEAEALEALYQIAVDNVAVARGLIRWQASRRA